MIKGSTGRFLTLVLAPLIVVAVTALVMLPRRGGDKVKVSADGPVVKIDRPQSNTRMHKGSFEIGATASDPDGLSLAELRVNGKREARANFQGSSDESVTFNWDAQKAGEFELSVRARDLNGSWGAAAEVTVRIEEDEVALPPPPTTVASAVTAGVDSTLASVPADSSTMPPTDPTDPSTTDGRDPSTTVTSPITGRPVPTTRATTPPGPGPNGTTPTTPLPPGTVATTQPTTTPTTLPTTTTTRPPCRVPRPSITVITVGYPRTVVGWSYQGLTCQPSAQRVRFFVQPTNIYGQPVQGGGTVEVPGTYRSAVSPALPSCTLVTARVTAIDEASPGDPESLGKTFTTSMDGCILPPTTTTTTTTTTAPPPTDPPPTDPPPIP